MRNFYIFIPILEMYKRNQHINSSIVENIFNIVLVYFTSRSKCPKYKSKKQNILKYQWFEAREIIKKAVNVR